MTEFAKGQAEFLVKATDEGVSEVAAKLLEIDRLLSSIQGKNTIKIDFGGKGSSINAQKSLFNSFTRFLKQVGDLGKKTGDELNKNLNMQDAADEAKKQTKGLKDTAKTNTEQSGKPKESVQAIKKMLDQERNQQKKTDAEYVSAYADSQQKRLDYLKQTLSKASESLVRSSSGDLEKFKLDNQEFEGGDTSKEALRFFAGRMLGPLYDLDKDSLSKLVSDLNRDQYDILKSVIDESSLSGDPTLPDFLSKQMKAESDYTLQDIFDGKKFKRLNTKLGNEAAAEYREGLEIFDKALLEKGRPKEDTVSFSDERLNKAKLAKKEQDKLVKQLQYEKDEAGKEDLMISIGVKESPTVEAALEKLEKIQEKANIKASFTVKTENLITELKNEFKKAGEEISKELGNIKIPTDSQAYKDLNLLKEIHDDLNPDKSKDNKNKDEQHGDESGKLSPENDIDSRFKSGIVKKSVTKRTNKANLDKAYEKARAEAEGTLKGIDFDGLNKLLKPLEKDPKYEKSVEDLRKGISKFKKTLKPEFDSSLLKDFAGQDSILAKFEEMKSGVKSFNAARKKLVQIASDKKLFSDLNKVESSAPKDSDKEIKPDIKESQTAAPVEVKLSPSIEEIAAQIDSLNNKTITLNVQFGKDGKGLESVLTENVKKAQKAAQEQLDGLSQENGAKKSPKKATRSSSTEDKNAAKLKRLQSQYDALKKGPFKINDDNLSKTMESQNAYTNFADNFKKYIEATNKKKKDSKYKIPKSVYKSLMDSLDYSMISKDNYAGSLADYFKSGMSVESVRGGQKKMSRADIRKAVAEARETYLGMIDKDIKSTQAKVTVPDAPKAAQTKTSTRSGKTSDTSITELNQQIAQLDNKPINLTISTTPEISSLSAKIEALGNTPVKINIEANPESLTGIKESIKSATDGLKLDLDLSSLTDAVTELKKSQNDGDQIQQQTEAILRDEFENERSSLVQQYEAKYNDLRTELSNLKSGLEQQAKKNVEDQTNAQIESLQKENSELSTRLQESQQKVLDIQGSLTSLVEQVQSSDSQTESLTSQLNSMGELINTLRGQLESTQDNAGERLDSLLNAVNTALAQVDAQRLTAEQRVHLRELENAGRNQRSSDRVQLGAQRVEVESQKTKRSQNQLEGKIATAEAQKEVAARVLETTVAQTAGAVKIVEASRDSQVKVIDKQIELSNKQAENELKVVDRKEKSNKKQYYRDQNSEDQKHRRELEKLDKKNEGTAQVAKEKADAQKYAADQKVKINEDNLAYKQAEAERKEEQKAAKEAEKLAAQNKYAGKIEDYTKLLESYGFDSEEIVKLSKDGKAVIDLTQRKKNEEGYYQVSGQRYTFTDFGEAIEKATKSVEAMSGSLTQEQKNAKFRESFIAEAAEKDKLKTYTERPSNIAFDPGAKIPQRMEGLFKWYGLESMKAGNFRVVDNEGFDSTGVIYDYDFGNGLKSYKVDDVKTILDSDDIGGLVNPAWLEQFGEIRDVMDKGLFTDTIRSGQEWKNAESRVRDLNDAIESLGSGANDEELNFYLEEQKRQQKLAKAAKQQYQSGMRELEEKSFLGDEERRQLVAAGDKVRGPHRQYQNFFDSEETRSDFNRTAREFVDSLKTARDDTKNYITDMVYPAKGKNPGKSRFDTYDEAIRNIDEAAKQVMYGNTSEKEYEKNLTAYNRAIGDAHKLLSTDIARKDGSLGNFLYTMNQDGSTAMKNQRVVRDSLQDYLKTLGASNIKVGRSKGKNFDKGMDYNVSYTRDGMDYKDVVRASSYNTVDGNQKLRFDRRSTSSVEHIGGMQKWMSNVGRKFASLSEFITGARMVDTLFAQAQQGFSFVKSLDSQLANINMTMSVTDEQLKAIGKSSIGLGEELSTNATNVLDAITIYANANESADSIIQKAKPTVMLANAAGVDTATSANWIQSVLRSRL